MAGRNCINETGDRSFIRYEGNRKINWRSPASFPVFDIKRLVLFSARSRFHDNVSSYNILQNRHVTVLLLILYVWRAGFCWFFFERERGAYDIQIYFPRVRFKSRGMLSLERMVGCSSSRSGNGGSSGYRRTVMANSSIMIRFRTGLYCWASRILSKGDGLFQTDDFASCCIFNTIYVAVGKIRTVLVGSPGDGRRVKDSKKKRDS